MTTYTLHLPRQARPGDPAALEKADIVKDGFSWGAFFFTFLWFFFHRLWLAGLLVLVGLVAFNIGLNVLDVHPAAGVFAHLLLSILIGFEANSLRRWTYERRGRPVVDVVTGGDRDEAEAKAFARWLQHAGPARSPVSSSVPQPYPPSLRPRQGAQPVIGLFPDAENFR